MSGEAHHRIAQEHALTFAGGAGTILLAGVVGSRAYGLSGPDSDEDYLCAVAANIDDILADGRTADQSWVRTDPDVTVHELGKLVRLLLACNPTVTELLWLDSYLADNEGGRLLIDARSDFLSAGRVRAAYAGYVRSQATRLAERQSEGFSAGGSRRIAKHARHCARLLIQGRTLLEHATLPIDVSAHADTIWDAGEQALADPTGFARQVQADADKLAQMPTALADQPRRDTARDLIVTLRRRLDTSAPQTSADEPPRT